MTVPTLIRVAAILHWIVAVGFGIFCFPAIRNLLIGRDIPIVMGFPALGRLQVRRHSRARAPSRGRSLLVGICLANPADPCPRLDHPDSLKLAAPAVNCSLIIEIAGLLEPLKE
jgi:hypothetical protein